MPQLNPFEQRPILEISDSTKRIFQQALTQADPFEYFIQNVDVMSDNKMILQYTHELVNLGVPITIESLLAAQSSKFEDVYNYLLNIIYLTPQESLKLIRALPTVSKIPDQLLREESRPPIVDVIKTHDIWRQSDVERLLRYYPESQELYLEIARNVEQSSILMSMLGKLEYISPQDRQIFINKLETEWIFRVDRAMEGIGPPVTKEDMGAYWLHRLRNPDAKINVINKAALLDTDQIYKFINARPENAAVYGERYVRNMKPIEGPRLSNWYYIVNNLVMHRNFLHLDTFFNLIPNNEDKFRLYQNMIRKKFRFRF